MPGVWLATGLTSRNSNAQRRMAALHDGPCRQPRLAAAFAAGQDAWPRDDAERFADFPAMGAEETAGPASLFKIAGARRVVREGRWNSGRDFGNASPAWSRTSTVTTPHPLDDRQLSTSSGCMRQPDRHRNYQSRSSFKFNRDIDQVKRLVIDLDDTITLSGSGDLYVE